MFRKFHYGLREIIYQSKYMYQTDVVFVFVDFSIAFIFTAYKTQCGAQNLHCKLGIGQSLLDLITIYFIYTLFA